MNAEATLAGERAPLNGRIGAIEYVEDFVFFFQDAVQRRCAEDEERLEFAQVQQAHDFVDIRGGKEDAADRGVGWALLVRAQFRRSDDLRAEIRRGADEEPDFAVVRESDLSLGASGMAEFGISNATAVFAGAVPLWESASCCRTQDFDAHDEPAEK